MIVLQCHLLLYSSNKLLKTNKRTGQIHNCLFSFLLFFPEMARDSSMMGRERVLIVPGSLSIDTSTTITGVTSHSNLGSNVSISGSGQQENQFNQQILEVSLHFFSSFFFAM
jgi:hypothetical protein